MLARVLSSKVSLFIALGKMSPSAELTCATMSVPDVMILVVVTLSRLYCRASRRAVSRRAAAKNGKAKAANFKGVYMLGQKERTGVSPNG